MLIQALAEYADTYLQDQLSDESWEEKPVPFFVSFDSQGMLLNLVTNTTQATRGKKTVSVAAPLSVPRSPVPRNSGLYPLLAADDIKYVLGAGPWTPKGREEDSQEKHGAFVQLIQLAAAETEDEGLKAAARFYNRPDQVEAARKLAEDQKAGAIVALALLNTPVVKSRLVRGYWTKHYQAVAAGRIAKGGDSECIISGTVGPIAPTHKKIKGLSSLKGLAEVSLMSFDKDAFRSYGWEQNANSPVCAERATAYVLALNDLLRHDKGRRRDIAGIGFIFWTKEKTDEDPMSTITQPTVDRIQRLFHLNASSNNSLSNLDPNMFYMAGVAGNGGRMIIRCWVAESLSKVRENLTGWFNGLSVIDIFSGKLSEPPSLWQLQSAIDRTAEPPADRTLTLVKRAIQGQPLGYRILAAVLARLRVQPEKRRDAVRAGLIRLCLNDNIRIRNKGERPMQPGLDQEQKHPAYLCGRLIAVYEYLQYKALGQVNQTIIDRYYTLASTFPQIAFPRLNDLANKHLRKLRRPANYGAYVAISKEVDHLCTEIEESSGYKFPKAFDLDSQGRFALGYHHQRSHQMSQAKVAKQADQDQTNSVFTEENL
jgi:CRISPR-associated protein Csd1